jgi:hypothetical protein
MGSLPIGLHRSSSSTAQAAAASRGGISNPQINSRPAPSQIPLELKNPKPPYEPEIKVFNFWCHGVIVNARCNIYGVYLLGDTGRESTKFTVVYGVYRFSPTLLVCMHMCVLVFVFVLCVLVFFLLFVLCAVTACAHAVHRQPNTMRPLTAMLTM